ncbi:hypothetical protein Avbf_00342 [Armadillidium vulgare]|nr:hypothetical protein Avbf_00342 [Armadillidium vulgare]
MAHGQEGHSVFANVIIPALFTRHQISVGDIISVGHIEYNILVHGNKQNFQYEKRQNTYVIELGSETNWDMLNVIRCNKISSKHFTLRIEPVTLTIQVYTHIISKRDVPTRLEDISPIHPIHPKIPTKHKIGVKDEISNSTLGVYDTAAVAADGAPCASIGVIY